MSTPLERLLHVLEAARIRLTPAEVSEAIWLATRVNVSSAVSGPDPPGRNPAIGEQARAGPEPERVDVHLPGPRTGGTAPEPRPPKAESPPSGRAATGPGEPGANEPAPL